ncbi:MAG: UDP-glucose 4-epimerase GalE [Candidatus Moranbacteria bacterium]|nr:UDP-glucose 4-epimerase GalE [Candidatus Moranbacteria bacterium]
MNLLVTGGAGYIGSHTVRKLNSAGHKVVIFDNLSSGHRDAIKDFELFEGDLANKEDLKKVFSQNQFDAVIHFAGSIEAGESMTDPKRFFENNFVCGLNLLEAMLESDVKKIVFSSSAAVYGEPEKMPIEETAPKNPTNIYGLTKLMFEQVLDAYDHAYGLKSVALRYFNATGADPSGEIGPDHKNKTHLLTLALLTALGKRDSVKIFGTDFPTADGTGIRDYVHVNDLADAHVLALEYLEKNNVSNKFNLGNEKGTSVRQVIRLAKEISGTDFKVIEEPRRDGDPASLFASSQKAKSILSWKPQFPEMKQIVETAWNWHKNHPDGFEK